MNLGAQWSPEHVVLAINLHERHLSGQLAADEFARLTGKTITRCAMIGKWHRLGLRAGNEPVVRKVRAPEKKRALRMVPSPPLSSPRPPSPPAETEPKLSGHRLGLRAGNEPVIRKVRAPEKRRSSAMELLPPLSTPPRRLPASAETEPELSPQPCDIIGLRFYDQCRWVMSDPRTFPVYYCGGQREFPGDEGRHKYCAHHGARAFAGKGR